MRPIPASAHAAIRTACAAIAEAVNANEPAHADAMALLADPSGWDADEAAWAIDQACEATAEHTEDGYERADIRALADAAIEAIG